MARPAPEVQDSLDNRVPLACSCSHQVVSDQSHTFRSESLEAIVILLILTEICLAFLKH